MVYISCLNLKVYSVNMNFSSDVIFVYIFLSHVKLGPHDINLCCANCGKYNNLYMSLIVHKTQAIHLIVGDRGPRFIRLFFTTKSPFALRSISPRYHKLESSYHDCNILLFFQKTGKDLGNSINSIIIFSQNIIF